MKPAQLKALLAALSAVLFALVTFGVIPENYVGVVMGLAGYLAGLPMKAPGSTDVVPEVVE